MDPLTLTIILSLFNPYINIASQSSLQLLFMLLSISLFVVYTVNLSVVQPWSCRVIYYFDTPTLGRRHQLFGRVSWLFLFFLMTGYELFFFFENFLIVMFFSLFFFLIARFENRTSDGRVENLVLLDCRVDLIIPDCGV